ncbi:MAG: peptidase T, partial [Clostridia bacterium]|nr:peptidase T [Clostridia bacterium]
FSKIDLLLENENTGSLNKKQNELIKSCEEDANKAILEGRIKEGDVLVIRYEGGDIILNEKLGIKMTVADYPNLNNYIGDDLIVTDGTTLLGADDKAGVAEIMDMVIRLKESKEEHGDILIGFTPDEEIGRGADLFDVEGFGADYAYTVDGGMIGEIEYENFNAASAVITVTGNSIHPGTAKNKMINAVQIAYELNSLLPAWERPEHTENYEGFFHLTNIEGNVESARIKYIIRDHDKTLFENKKAAMSAACDFINKKYGKNIVDCKIKDSYYNMKELIEGSYYIVKRLVKAMEDEGVTPKIIPIRGGTDGARLSFMGLLCPNICTGGENFHGKYEFISVQKLEKVSDILYRLCINAVKD